MRAVQGNFPQIRNPFVLLRFPMNLLKEAPGFRRPVSTEVIAIEYLIGETPIGFRCILEESDSFESDC